MNVYGKNVINSLLKNNREIIQAYVYKNFKDKKIIDALKQRNIKIKWLEKYELDKLVGRSHQGIILKIPPFQYTNLNEFTHQEEALVVILDHIEDPQNLGAIIRTCEAAAVNGIIIPKDRSASVNETVMKVSAGALDNIPLAQVTNLTRTIKDLKKKGFWIIGSALEGTTFEHLDYQGKIAIVIGNEGKGLSRLVKEECDFMAKIPMFGKINSLNASVAAGIIIYKAQMVRRKGNEISKL